MTTASDNFDRANETPLASPWANWTSAGALLSGNKATAAAAVTAASLYNSGTWSNDQEASGVVGNLGSTLRYACVGVRAGTSSGGSGYVCFTDGDSGSGHTGIEKITNGTEIELKGVAATFTAGDTIGIRAVGTTISMWKNGTQIDSTTDSTYSSGNPGVWFYSQATIDDWQAADVGTSSGGSGFRAAFARHANQTIL